MQMPSWRTHVSGDSGRVLPADHRQIGCALCIPGYWVTLAVDAQALGNSCSRVNQSNGCLVRNRHSLGCLPWSSLSWDGTAPCIILRTNSLYSAM